MCKHKSGSGQDEQAATSTSEEAKGTVNSMDDAVDPREVTLVPVHGQDDPDETSPMVSSADESADCGEHSGLLSGGDLPDTLNSMEGVQLASRKRSRWMSGVVVYPSVGSLTSEWKDDLSQCNSLMNLGTEACCVSCAEDPNRCCNEHCHFFSINTRPRSASLTQVKDLLNDYPSSSNSGENNVATPSEVPLPISPSPFLHHHKLIKKLQYSASVASSLTDGGNAPICKICHLTSSPNDPLISPCRCSGTMQFIHCNCLMKWLEYSSKRTRRPPTCELCQYQYHWHKKFKVGRWQFPHCSQRDKLFHVTFFLALAVMIACASITIMCFKQDKGIRVSHDSTELTESEIVTLVCGVLFFIAFFLAMYVEVKARNNVYRLFLKFLYMNQQWYFDEYEKKEGSVVSV